MDDSYDNLPPYPGLPPYRGVSFPTGSASPPPEPHGPYPPPYDAARGHYPPPDNAGGAPYGRPHAGGPYPPPGDGAYLPAAGSAGPPPASRRWLGVAMGGGAVLLAIGAFFLGHSTARASSSVADATTLNALTSATTATAAPACAGPRRAAAGTLKSVSGSTLVISSPKGTDVTVKTDSSTKVTKVVPGVLSDVSPGAAVAVRGTANGTTIAADHVGVLPAGAAGPLMGGRGLGPRAQAFGLAVGTVQSVTSSGFTITSGGSTITVTTSSATVFAKTTSATVSDLVVGQPIAVGGTPNSDGSITATSVAQSTVTGGLGKIPGLGFGFGFGFGGARGRGPGGP